MTEAKSGREQEPDPYGMTEADALELLRRDVEIGRLVKALAPRTEPAATKFWTSTSPCDADPWLRRYYGR